jgi:hypothetical protein
MADVGKILVGLGVIVAIVGGLLIVLGRAGFRGLPGDVSYESPNVRVYFPIVTCIVLSVVLTLGMWVWRWLSGR